MSKKSARSILNLNLLRPQGESKKLLANALTWILSAGRYIVILVEIVVLAAFLSRFKLDADIQETKEKIEAQIPFIEVQKDSEVAIRQTQLQLSNIKNIKNESPRYSEVLDKIASQTPGGVVLNNLSIDKTAGKLELKLSGTAQNNNELNTFIYGLKSDPSFSEVNLANAGLDQNLISFSLTAVMNVSGTKL